MEERKKLRPLLYSRIYYSRSGRGGCVLLGRTRSMPGVRHLDEYLYGGARLSSAHNPGCSL